MNEKMLDIAIISKLEDDLQERDKQLQAYKDKENKLREFIDKEVGVYIDKWEVLQILNEGGNE